MGRDRKRVRVREMGRDRKRWVWDRNIRLQTHTLVWPTHGT
jgi:hypothetical protein